jgi:hypothetical protein
LVASWDAVPDDGPTILSISDGTSNTLLLAEIRRASGYKSTFAVRAVMDVPSTTAAGHDPAAQSAGESRPVRSRFVVRSKRYAAGYRL